MDLIHTCILQHRSCYLIQLLLLNIITGDNFNIPNPKIELLVFRVYIKNELCEL